MSVMRHIAEAAWDEASFRLRALGERHAAVAATLGYVAERAQRPRLGVRRARAGFEFRGNDRQLLACLEGVFSRGRSGSDSGWGSGVTVSEIPWWRARGAMREGALVLPRWVGLEVDLSRERLDERRRAAMRRAAARGLVAEVVPAAQALDEFFERFYRPTAIARHGENAYVRRARYLAKGDGSIVFVREGERRAGMLLVPRDAHTIDAWVTGVRDGVYDDATVRDALYVFAMREARARGARTFGLTAAPPFLGDGLLRYKRSFGARAVPLRTSPIAVRIDIRRPSDVAAAFARSPPIVDANGLRAVSLTHTPFAIDGVEGPAIVDDLSAWARAQVRSDK